MRFAHTLNASPPTTRQNNLMNIFSNLIQAAQEAADEAIIHFPIGSQRYETGIKLAKALEPFLEKEGDVIADEAPTQ